MTARAEPIGDPAGRLPVRFLVAVAVPLSVAALAYALWWISDRLVYIGPLDRAAFGGIVVTPVWLAAPVAAGFLWGGLPRRDGILAAAVVGAVISAVVGAVFWQAVTSPVCESGPTQAPIEWLLPCLALGVVVGAGIAVSGLLASRFARDGRAWSTVVVGAGAEVVMVVAAIIVVGVMLMGPGCQHPQL